MKTLTENDARQSLNGHVEAKGREIQQQYGPEITSETLRQILSDSNFVRYPCEIRFDLAPLQEEEIAFAAPKGESPEEGYTIFVHPFFSTDPHAVVAIALYQLVVVNYGDFASSDDAETFGSAVLGLSKEAYYSRLCELADQITDPEG